MINNKKAAFKRCLSLKKLFLPNVNHVWGVSMSSKYVCSTLHNVANVGSGVIITLLRPAGDSDESSVQCTA